MSTCLGLTWQEFDPTEALKMTFATARILWIKGYADTQLSLSVNFSRKDTDITQIIHFEHVLADKR